MQWALRTLASGGVKGSGLWSALFLPAKVPVMTEFPQTSTQLGLPYLQPAQAQKHVTHNEALLLLDRLVHLAVVTRTVTSPPVPAQDGARYLVPVGATGDWTAQDGKIAVLDAGVWQFFAPRAGWLVLVLDEARLLYFDNVAWVLPDVMADQVAQLGIATSADSTNRLAVAAPATLFTHSGAGHQVKVNKALAADTASLLFQTGFAGRAEMGLTGSDDFALKVSADGSTWAEGLRVIAASGQVQIDSGLHVTGQITGSAVTQSPLDDTTGRVLRVGDSATVLSASPAVRATLSGSANALIATTGAGFNAPPPTGFKFRFRAGAANTGPATLALDGGAATACRTVTGVPLPAGYVRADADTDAVFDGTHWVLSRAVEQISAPTGTVLRLDCGIQQVWATRPTVGTISATAWTFPATFAVAPDAGATAMGTAPHIAMLSNVTATGCGFDAWTLAGARADGVAVSLRAAGRWY